MFYKEIKKLKKSELQELLATTLQQKATLERANCSLNDSNSEYYYTIKELENDYKYLKKELKEAEAELYKNIDERDLEIDDLGHSLSDVNAELLEVEAELIELRADNQRNVSELNDKYSALNKWWSDRYNDLQNDIIDTSQELLETETELVEVRASVIKLDDINTEYYNTIKELESDNKIHLREKQEAREIAENYSLSNNKLRNELAEGSAPKNIYIHEIETIFADSGELHLVADDNKNIVFNCSNLVQDLATINDVVIQSAKRDLKDSIQQIKQLTKDI